MYFNYYSLPLIGVSVLMLVLGLRVRTERSVPGVGYFSALMFAGMLYSLFYAFEISSNNLYLIRLFYKLEYIGIPFIPAFFLLFAISYTRKQTLSSPLILTIVLSAPVVTFLLAVTYDFHQLFITEGGIDSNGLFPAFIFTPRIGYRIHSVYSIASVFLGIVLLFRMWLNSAPAFKNQVGVILSGSIVPFVVFILYIAGFFPRGLDPSPFAFAVTGVFVFYGITRLGLFRIAPLARNMLFDNLPDGVVVIDRHYRLVDFNRAASTVFGIGAGDIGRLTGEIFSGWPEILASLAERKSFIKFEISRIKKGKALFLDCRISRLRDKRRHENGHIIVVHDVTLQRRTELEKEESEERFRIIFENAPLGITYFDKNGLIELCNDYFISLIGSSEERIIGLNMKQLSDKRIQSVTERTLREGKRAVFEGEYVSETGNRTVYIRALFQPLLSRDNEVEGGLCIMEDISGRRAAQEKIRRTNNELARLNAEKDKFFSILAHDLRTPFSSFLGFADILQESPQDMSSDMIRSIALSMKESASNLYNLLENLLEWSRVRQGVVKYNPESLNLRDRILNCIEPMLTFANQKLIDVEYEIPEDIEIFADLKMFETVVRNLFTNGVKFTGREGSISIFVNNSDDNHVELCFMDNGIGMSTEMAEGLFRLDLKSSRQGTEGELSSGLGLILCKEFMAINEGSIRVESEENKGSRFYITFKKSYGKQES